MTPRLTICLALTILCGGCGGGAPPISGPARQALTGTVTFNGEPVEGGSIAFVGQSAELRNCGAPITEGKYALTRENGPNVGKYTVQIRWQRPLGKKVKNLDTGKEEETSVEVIPKKYNDSSNETVEIQSGSNTFDFAITK